MEASDAESVLGTRHGGTTKELDAARAEGEQHQPATKSGKSDGLAMSPGSAARKKPVECALAVF